MNNFLKKVSDSWKNTGWQEKTYTVSVLLGFFFIILYSLFPILRNNLVSDIIIMVTIFEIYGGLVYAAGESFYNITSGINVIGSFVAGIFIGVFACVIGNGFFVSMISFSLQNSNYSFDQKMNLGEITSLVITIGGIILTILVKKFYELKGWQ